MQVPKKRPDPRDGNPLKAVSDAHPRASEHPRDKVNAKPNPAKKRRNPRTLKVYDPGTRQGGKKRPQLVYPRRTGSSAADCLPACLPDVGPVVRGGGRPATVSCHSGGRDVCRVDGVGRRVGLFCLLDLGMELGWGCFNFFFLALCFAPRSSRVCVVEVGWDGQLCASRRRGLRGHLAAGLAWKTRRRWRHVKSRGRVRIEG